MGERLAQVIRESFLSLNDFSNDCANEPVRFCIGAGDSLIQWLLIPTIGKLQGEFSRLVLRVQNLRTRAIVSGLQEMSLDFGVLRRDAVIGSLKWKPLGQIDYALYVPVKLLPRKSEATLQWALDNLSIAIQSSNGQFNQRLHEIARKLKTRLNVSLECEMFPHAMGGSPDRSVYDTVFVDSITVASRMAFQWSQKQPAAFSEKTGKPDNRGAYGLLGQEMIRWITRSQRILTVRVGRGVPRSLIGVLSNTSRKRRTRR